MNLSNVKSEYERELIVVFFKKLKMHMSKGKVKKCLKDKSDVDYEIIRFTKKFDENNLTNFYESIKVGAE